MKFRDLQLEMDYYRHPKPDMISYIIIQLVRSKYQVIDFTTFEVSEFLLE